MNACIKWNYIKYNIISYWNEKYLKMNRNINNIEHNKNNDFSKINACINKCFNKWKLSKNK